MCFEGKCSLRKQNHCCHSIQIWRLLPVFLVAAGGPEGAGRGGGTAWAGRAPRTFFPRRCRDFPEVCVRKDDSGKQEKITFLNR